MQGKLLWTLPRTKAALYYKQVAIDAAILALWTGCYLTIQGLIETIDIV